MRKNTGFTTGNKSCFAQHKSATSTPAGHLVRSPVQLTLHSQPRTPLAACTLHDYYSNTSHLAQLL